MNKLDSNLLRGDKNPRETYDKYRRNKSGFLEVGERRRKREERKSEREIEITVKFKVNEKYYLSLLSKLNIL